MSAYPWNALEPLERESLELISVARRAAQPAAGIGKIEAALSAVLGCDGRLSPRRLRTGAPDASPHAVALTLNGCLPIVVDPESALVTEAIGRVVGRPPGIASPTPECDPALLGAMGAIVAEVARRAGATARAAACPPEPSGRSVGADWALTLDGTAYEVSTWVWPDGAHAVTSSQVSRPLRELGGTPIGLGLVTAASLAAREDLEALTPGDVWLPGEGWWIDQSGAGRALLLAECGEHGVWVDLAPNGRVVLRSDLGHLEAAPECIEEADVMTDSEEKVRDAVTTAALDAPLVIRVEMGAVTLPARQWAEVAPGDVLRTGRRIADPVTLRVAGHAVALGELVNVEGELGVRIRELCDGGDA